MSRGVFAWLKDPFPDAPRHIKFLLGVIAAMLTLGLLIAALDPGGPLHDYFCPVCRTKKKA